MAKSYEQVQDKREQEYSIYTALKEKYTKQTKGEHKTMEEIKVMIT